MKNKILADKKLSQMTTSVCHTKTDATPHCPNDQKKVYSSTKQKNKEIQMDKKCLTYKELAQYLGFMKSTIRKEWRYYPHYFASRGENLKSARFDLEEVIKFLKEKRNGIPKVHRKRREVPSPIQIQGANIQPRRKDKKRGRGMESGNHKTTQKKGEKGDSRFDVFNYY